MLEKIWQLTRNLCAHPAYLLNPSILKFSIPPMVITLHKSKILLSLNCFLTRKFQTFTNLLIETFSLVIPPIFFFFFFFFEIDWSNASVIVTIISNITCLQFYLLRILVPIRRLLQLIVCIGVSIPSWKTSPLLFRQVCS